MGCSESREDKKQTSSVYSLKTPLPLHLYSYSSTTSPKSSPTNQSLTPKSPKSPTSKSYDTPTKTHLSRLNSIAHFKFPTFHEFQPNVKQEILLHIDKELQKQ